MMHGQKNIKLSKWYSRSDIIIKQYDNNEVQSFYFWINHS
jgi:hypothetical protein